MMGEGRKAELKSQPWGHFQLHSLCSRNPGPVPVPGVSVAGKGQHLPVLFRIQLQGRAWLAWVICPSMGGAGGTTSPAAPQDCVQQEGAVP